MKKLMIAMAAMAVGFAANAATCNWSGLSVKLQNSADTATNYLVLLLDSSVTTASDMAGYLAKADTSYLSAAKVGSTTALKAGTAARWMESGWGDFTAGDTFTYYTVILNTTDSTDISTATYYMMTSEKTAKAPSNGTLNMQFGTQASNSWVKMEGGSAPVPEPTSGMLLMFGLATLALRRRRA